MKTTASVEPNSCSAPDKIIDGDNSPQSILSSGDPVNIGGERLSGEMPIPLEVGPCKLFGPRGAMVGGKNGPLWVADTGHHRLLGWKNLPQGPEVPADWVIGQKDFVTEGRNSKGLPKPASFNVPTGIAPYEKGMVVADAWNHRVLIWNHFPEENNVPPDLVLGQKNFHEAEPNRGQSAPGADTFYWPYGVFYYGNKLFVADSKNRRVLIWNELPVENGQPADQVLGQVDFISQDENAGSSPNHMSMRWPHDITVWRENLCITDAGNNRIMVWKGIPRSNGAPCEYILGQLDETGSDHNQGSYFPTDSCLNMPYGVSAKGDWLLVADTASSRLLGWHIDDLNTGVKARALAGQPDFQAKGDNQWQAVTERSMCWPYGLQACGDKIIIADSGNSRVQIWEIPR